MSRREPVQGQRLELSLDLELAAGRRRRAARRQAANANGNPARAGAFVAMDPTNGEVLALGSYPSFDAERVRQADLPASATTSSSSRGPGAPLFNRAIDGRLSDGLDFKPITALAALDERHHARRAQIINDTGRFEIGDQVTLQRQGRASTARSTCRGALKVSSDVYFYTLGA